MKNLVVSGLLLFSGTLHAHNLQTNSPLPLLKVSDKGELVLNSDEVKYTSWSTSNTSNKVKVLLHMAGTKAAKAINQNFIDQLKAAKFDRRYYQTITIVNRDEAIWGTGIFVANKLEENKRQYPSNVFVIDDDSQVKEQLALASDSSAVILLSPKNTVRFVKEGRLSEQEIAQVLSLINKEIKLMD